MAGKKRPTWLIVLIAAGVVLVAGAAGAAVGAYFLFRALTGPADTAKAFLADLSNGRSDQAYAETAQVFKTETSKDEFNEFVGQYGILKSVKAFAISEVNIENDLARANGTITGTDGAVAPTIVTLVKEHGAWRVATVELQPNTPPSSAQ